MYDLFIIEHAELTHDWNYWEWNLWFLREVCISFETTSLARD